MSASVKSLLSTLTSRGPHRVLRGNLAIAGQPGVVFTPESGRGLPAVVFGHGWLTGVGNYRELLEHLASWGFVAAAPDTERGPIPSHLGLATDLLTTVDICTGVRLGDGEISVNPERIALAGHGMGAGAAVIAAGQRRVAALAALFPAPTAPSAETLAPNIDIPALVLAGSTDIASVNSNALPLTSAWGGPALLRAIDGASQNGIIEGRRALAALGAGKHQPKVSRTTRALLVGYLRHTLLDEKTYKPFTDPEAQIPHTHVIDPDAPREEESKPKLSVGTIASLLRK
ncbi:poly(ethylene terephthalate) hydrolase family protein [Nocardia puris]|uniref:poly(ethylene terephthalate) hydrolase family protein n=1 Tax=Nocardia puris TaxID=208602 RepID=UPI0008346B85|nr:dienelactone hydrolase family protein [Nocardia puris]